MGRRQLSKNLNVTYDWLPRAKTAKCEVWSTPPLTVFQGDSGGPLLYNGIAVGITSNGGKKCGQIKKPGIYTVISHYTEWIDRTMALQNTEDTDQSS